MKISTSMNDLGTICAKRAAIITAAAALAVASMGISPAAAHGVNAPNLKRYCATLFKFDKRHGAHRRHNINYFYSAKKRRWVCRLSVPHFRRGGRHLIKTFRAADACRWQLGTRRVHVRQGRLINGRPFIHCGVRGGFVHRHGHRHISRYRDNWSRTRVHHGSYPRHEPGRTRYVFRN